MTLEFVSCIVVNAVVDIADSLVCPEIYIIFLCMSYQYLKLEPFTLMLMCFAEAILVSNPTRPIEIGYYELVLYGVAVRDLLYSGLSQNVAQFSS
jgi:hypothetical protein